jgi:5-methylcytosine-specific restriction endonuclease McrA
LQSHSPIYAPLSKKELELNAGTARVLYFDPTPCYHNYTSLNVFKRLNPRRLEQAFPKKNDGLCSCGCGVALTGKQRRWASEACTKFALNVTDIIAGVAGTVVFYLSQYNGGTFCQHCGCGEEQFQQGDIFRTNIEADHIIPVHRGGGACWLNNYQLVCISCHKAKTKTDGSGRFKNNRLTLAL